MQTLPLQIEPFFFPNKKASLEKGLILFFFFKGLIL